MVMGRLLAALPEPALEAVCRGLGWLLATLPGRRRRTVESNLHHAFPEKDAAWRREVALEAACRTIETGFFALISPLWNKKQMMDRFKLDPLLQQLVTEFQHGPQPLVVMTPHFSLMEATVVLPSLVSGPLPDLAAIYRPFDAPGLEAWVKRTRERWGLRLLSRKDGHFEAVDVLRRKGAVVVLFDQNAGDRGALTLFMDRVCSTSELAGFLAEKCKARVGIIYSERTGFMRSCLRGEYLFDAGPNANETLFAANRWLEKKLLAGGEPCRDWLWLHARWRHQDQVKRRFRLQSKHNLLPEQLAWLKKNALPRRTRFWVRMPNWLGDVIMALPLLRALRQSRPDAEITLLAQPVFAPLLARLGVGDRIVALPPRGEGYFKFFRELRGEYPDTHILLTNSWRGDYEAKLAGAPQRFGMRRPGQWRPWLTHAWIAPGEADEAREHQLQSWLKFFQHFGLEGELDLVPFAWPGELHPALAQPKTGPVLGFICGTENFPEKRWPVERWRELIAGALGRRLETRFELFGTARDAEITTAVAAGQPAGHVFNHAGKTNLMEFAEALRRCDVVVCNDTGGMHLANALGVPVVAVYGPTNPVRTGPVFAAPKILLQPNDCPPTGGAKLADLPAAKVLAALAPWLLAERV